MFESRLKPPPDPDEPPEPPMEREYVESGAYPELGSPVRVGVTVDVLEWQPPPPQPFDELPVLPLLYAKAVSGTETSIMENRNSAIAILVFLLLPSIISHQFLYWFHQRGLSDWSDSLCNI
tara:strand:+ start:137 stop:499 length:363 start_codon:yes stop_codon:yes gene_type:complete